MAILGNIRKTGNTFVVVVIAFFVVMFLGSELPRLLPYFFSSKGQIGRLSGKQISQVDYRKFCEAIHRNFVSQGKQPTEGDQQRIKDQAFRYLIEHALYSQEIEAAGIAVGPQELVDLVQGDHIDPALMEFFKNPETAAFDKKKLLAYLSNLSKTPKEQQAAWCGFEKDLALKRAKEKLHQLMVQSAFHTAIEGDHTAKHAHTFCKVDYLFIPFSSVKNDLVPLNNQQLLDYMAAHKYHYTALSASRTIKYMAFPIEPNEKDRADFQKELNALVVQFSTVSDPYAFAKQHTDGSAADTKLVSTADTLPNAFKTIKHTLKEGMVVGPVADDPFHTLYKLVKVAGGNYEIACIEKKPMVSDHTRNKQLSHLQHLTRQIKTVADLEQLAATEELTVQKDTLAPSNGSIGGYAAARKVVRWLYNEATLGKVSPLFDLGNVYLLAVMVDQVQAGDLVPLDSVRRAVYQKVLRQEKAKVILDKLKQVQANTLQGIAEQYGEGITIQSVDQLRYLENKDPELKQAQAFIGKCFGLKTNVISDPIVDENGVFIASVKNRDADKTGKEETQQPDNDRMSQIEGWMQRYYIPTAMEELAKVVDERYKIE